MQDYSISSALAMDTAVFHKAIHEWLNSPAGDNFS